jgi:hypothetical protein
LINISKNHASTLVLTNDNVKPLQQMFLLYIIKLKDGKYNKEELELYENFDGVYNIDDYGYLNEETVLSKTSENKINKYIRLTLINLQLIVKNVIDHTVNKLFMFLAMYTQSIVYEKLKNILPPKSWFLFPSNEFNTNEMRTEITASISIFIGKNVDTEVIIFIINFIGLIYSKFTSDESRKEWLDKFDEPRKDYDNIKSRFIIKLIELINDNLPDSIKENDKVDLLLILKSIIDNIELHK